jgi:hypothetical protein
LSKHELEERAISELLQRRKEIVERELAPVQKKFREQSQKLYSNLVKQLEDEDSEFGKHSFLNGMEAYIDKFRQPEIRRWKSAVKRFLSDGLYIMDDDGNPVMYCETDEVYWDFVNEILEKNPVGYPPPPLDKDYLDRIVDINEYGYLEIIMADDLTEALLLITNRLSGISQTTTAEDYCKMRNILTWDVDARILDGDFEDELQSIVEEGKQLLATIS